MVFISLIQSLSKTPPLNVFAAKLKGSTEIAPSVRLLLLASYPSAALAVRRRGRSDRADLIKFADGESDDYSAGRKGEGRGGRDDNENNCGGGGGWAHPFPPPTGSPSSLWSL